MRDGIDRGGVCMLPCQGWFAVRGALCAVAIAVASNIPSTMAELLRGNFIPDAPAAQTRFLIDVYSRRRSCPPIRKMIVGCPIHGGELRSTAIYTRVGPVLTQIVRPAASST